MYTKIVAQGTKFGSGATGLDNPDLHYSSGTQPGVLVSFVTL